MKKIFIFMILFCFLLIFPMYTYADIIKDSLNITLDTESGFTQGEGEKIIVNDNSVLYSIEIHPSSTVTRLRIFNNSIGNSCIDNTGLEATYTRTAGQNFTIGNFTLIKDKTYYLIYDVDCVTSYTRRYTCVTSYPYSATIINYTNGYGKDGGTGEVACAFDMLATYTAITSIPQFVSPTPDEGTANNTQVNINVSCDIGNLTLWFDNNTNPTTKVIDDFNNIANWTTNVTTSDTYYYKASCDQGLTNGTIRTWIYDIEKPTITINPNNFFSSDNTSRFSTTASNKNMNFTLQDNHNLFAYFINITNDNNIEYYSNLNTSLSGTVKTIIEYVNYSNWDLGNYTVEIIASDSHTAHEIPNYNIIKKKSKLEFNTEAKNKIQISSKSNSKTNYIKTQDRYSFVFDFDRTGTQDEIFYIESDNPIIYLPKSKYKAHFVVWNTETKNGNWIDFEGINGDPEVTKINDFLYKITIKNLEKEVIFNSIGGLNIQTEFYKFELLSIYPFSPNVYIAGIKQFNYTGEFNESADISFNISVINNILENNCNCINCSINGNYCQIPITFNSETTSILQVDLINDSYSYGMDNCSNSYNIPSNYSSLFFNFKDESNENIIFADVDTQWYYNIDIGNSGVFNYDANNIYNFSMCIYPSWSNIDVNYSIFYSNTPDYPQRRYNNEETLTNVLSSTTLFLLNLTSGIYGRFKTVDNYDNVLSGVTIRMKNVNTEQTIEQEITDAAGLATFFLNPDSDYLFEYSKIGYETVSEVLRITTAEIYTVSLKSETQTGVIDIQTGSMYQFSPNIPTLQNNTNYTFDFNLSSYQKDITSCTLYIYQNLTLISSSSSTYNTSNCDISITTNTLNYTSIVSRAIYVLNDTSITKEKKYLITSYSQGEYSLKTFIDDLTNFSGAGFNDSGRFIIAFIIIFALVGYITSKFTGIINAPALILLIWILVGFFSYIGWLYMDFSTIPNIPGFNLKKYIIFILITLLTGGYILKRMN